VQVSDLNNLIMMYKEWAFQLYPGMSRDDLMDDAAKMGSKPSVKGYMSRLRDDERDRYIVSFFLS
jgi:hypothetical protein